MRLDKNNDYYKAKAFIADRNNSIKKIAERTDISVARLNFFRANPEKLETAHWVSVYQLARLSEEGDEE